MELHYRPDVKEVLDGMVLGMPGVSAGHAFGHPAYKVNGRIFAFVGVDGISIKLPARRVAELIASHPTTMQIFKPDGQRSWKEWLSIELPDAHAYNDYAHLLEESVSFVLG
jgi:hypothetical protein